MQDYPAIGTAGLLLSIMLVLCGCPAGGNSDNQAINSNTPADISAGQNAVQAPVEQPAEPAVPKHNVWVGDAVDFSCTTFDGETIRASGLNKPLIVNFWAAW